LWATAALQNHPGALVRLARVLEEGVHLPQDPKQAMIFWMRAEQAGSSEAAIRVADARFSGKGLRRDPAEGLRALTRAAERGYPEAQRRLAALFEQGRHAPRDGQRALDWYRRAARSGWAPAQNDLGVFLALQNRPEARREAWAWFQMAADRGDPRAASNRDELERRMGFLELRSARKLYRQSAPGVPMAPPAAD